MVLQAAVRMHVNRSLYRRQREAAVLIQSTVRRMQQRSKFIQVGNHASWHAELFYSIWPCVEDHCSKCSRHMSLIGASVSRQRTISLMHMQLRRAAICVQKMRRGHDVRVAIAQHAAAATVVQKCWRGCIQRCTYQRMRTAVVRLQSAMRCWQLRGRFLQARSAAVTMQVQKLYKKRIKAEG